jgi:hypothetical protein
MKYIYTFISAGCWGECSYNVYENVTIENIGDGVRVAAVGRIPNFRVPGVFLEWWTGTRDFDHKGYFFETEECVNKALNRWIAEKIQSRLGVNHDILDDMIHAMYSRWASNVNNRGMLGQLEQMLTHGISPHEILKEHGIEATPEELASRGQTPA